MEIIKVRAEHAYDVIVGRNLLDQIRNHIGEADRVAVIHPRALRETGELIRSSLENVISIAIEIPEAEEAKTFDVVKFCWMALGQSGFTRNDLVIAVGGGATTDLAGFVAATWLRGIRIINIPTTLLGMVDAAIGGKTGINTDEGKNLVGSFHSPSAVFCDLNALQSMSENDYVGGLAEVIKAGFIRDARILELIESDPEGAKSPSWEFTQEIITRSVQVKADVVSNDLKEQLNSDAGREILNYGHTLGHAIERNEKYSWRHGAAVSVGMMYVANLANLSGALNESVVDRHRNILQAVGLPVSYKAGAWTELLAAMKMDKKARGDLLRFVILKDVGKPALLEGPDPALLVAAYQEIVQS